MSLSEQKISTTLREGSLKEIADMLDEVPLEEIRRESLSPIIRIIWRKDWSSEEKIEAIDLLLDRGVVIERDTPDSYSPFLKAVEEGDSRLMRALAKRGATTEFPLSTWQSVHYLPLQTLDPLLDLGVPLSTIGPAFLTYSIFHGYPDRVQKLLDKGVSPNETNEYDWPALVSAASKKHGSALEIVQILLEAGADIESQTPSGETALMWAVKEGRLEVIEYLVQAGANVEATNEKELGLYSLTDSEEKHQLLEKLEVPHLSPRGKKVKYYALVLEGKDGEVRIELGEDFSSWEEIYNSAGVISDKEPDQEQVGEVLVGKITSPFSLGETIDTMVHDGGLLSAEVEEKLRRALEG